MNLQISASITDFPLQTPIETFFRKFKEAGVDTVELVIGAKTINVPRMFALSQKYQLPIVSFHQSPWSGFGFSFDENFIIQAKQYGVTTYTFHPLTFMSFDSKQMKQYFIKLKEIQEKYAITICLENMPPEFFYKKLFDTSDKTIISHLESMYIIAKQYNLSLTYDVSHTQFTHPQNHDIFREMLSRIKNIHISSFHGDQEHLPLDKGDFATKAFVQFLYKQKYTGLLTFEINYSLTKRIFTPYNFLEIKRSIDIIKSVSDKSS